MFLATALVHLIATAPSMRSYYEQILARLTYDHKSLSMQEKNVVVFVHGRNANSAQFAHVIQTLSGDSGTLIVNEKEYYLRAVDLGETGYSSLEEDATSLHNEMEELVGCNITLVGVSKGGLISMKYVTSFTDPRIKRVMTISSPLQGTHITKILKWSGWGNIEADMGYNNKEVKSITKLAQDLTIPLYHVVPTYDHLIIPTSSSFYSFTPEENMLRYKGYANHGVILYEKEVLDFLVDVLGK